MQNLLEMLKLVMSKLVDLSAVLENKRNLSLSCSVSFFAWTCTVELDHDAVENASHYSMCLRGCRKNSLRLAHQ